MIDKDYPAYRSLFYSFLEKSGKENTATQLRGGGEK
jgi:hypothetical protein